MAKKKKDKGALKWPQTIIQNVVKKRKKWQKSTWAKGGQKQQNNGQNLTKMSVNIPKWPGNVEPLQKSPHRQASFNCLTV